MTDELYRVPGGDLARRYWALDGRILVGGRILSVVDAEHLRAHYRVTHVLSAENEQTDEATWLDPATRACLGWPDDGQRPDLETVRAAVAFTRIVLADPAAVLHTHCRLGGSRGPSYAYMALRVLGHDPGRSAQMSGRKARSGHELEPNYVAVIEEALAP